MSFTGRRLRQLRGNRTRQAVARDLGITVEALRAYEQGKRVPRDEVILRAAMYFRVPANFMRPVRR